MFARLLEQQLGVAAGGQTDQLKFAGKSSATLMVLVPMDPVLPSRTTFFIESKRDANRDT